VTEEKLEAAKAGLAEATKGWNDATAAYRSGNITDAVAKAGTVKQETVEALETLGMPCRRQPRPRHDDPDHRRPGDAEAAPDRRRGSARNHDAPV
jgi:hypothetical protein